MTQTKPPASTASEPPNAPSMRGRIGRVAGASAIALLFGEILTLAQTVALARMLSPAEVGIFISGTVITSFLAEFVEGGLRAGLVQREHDIADAAETVFWATLAGGFLGSLGALAASPIIGLVFDNSTAGLIAASTSATLLIYSLTNVPESMLQREFSVRRRIIVGPAVGVSYAAVAITCAAYGLGVWSMVFGMYASFITWVIAVWLITDWRPGRGRASVPMWRELARFGMPLVLGAIGARVQNAAEAVVVGRGLTVGALGNFRYGQRISQIPVRAIIEIGAVSLFPAFSRMAQDRARLREAYLRAMRWVTVAAAPLCGLMFALGGPAVTVVFGDPWRHAGVAVMAMAGLGLGKAFISVSEELIKACGRTPLLNWYTLVELSVGLGTLLLLVHQFDLVGAALSISITALVVGIVVIHLAIPLVEVSWMQVMRAVAPPLPAAVVAAAATWSIDRQVLHSDAQSIAMAVTFLMIESIVFVIVYAMALGLTAPHMVRQMARLVGKVATRR